jgi:hypothetical protein
MALPLNHFLLKTFWQELSLLASQLPLLVMVVVVVVVVVATEVVHPFWPFVSCSTVFTNHQILYHYPRDFNKVLSYVNLQTDTVTNAAQYIKG